MEGFLFMACCNVPTDNIGLAIPNAQWIARKPQLRATRFPVSSKPVMQPSIAHPTTASGLGGNRFQLMWEIQGWGHERLKNSNNYMNLREWCFPLMPAPICLANRAYKILAAPFLGHLAQDLTLACIHNPNHK
jgi:hypothetical protein